MAVYAAMSSLKHQRLLKSSNILFFPSPNILQIAYEEVRSLQEYIGSLGSSDTKKVNALNAQIRDVVCKLEDAIVYHTSNQFLSQTENQMNIEAGEILSLDLREVKQEICSFTETVKRMEEENRIEDLLAGEDDNIPLRTDFGGKCSRMVGFSDLFKEVKDALRNPRYWSTWRVVSLVGMAGIGKTTLAMKIFEDPEILSSYEHRAFVSIGPKYQLKEVMLDILAQLTPHIDEIRKKEVKDVGKCLDEALRNMTYLIVLDDVWDKSIYDLIEYLPIGTDSVVLVTTTIRTVANNAPIDTKVYQMPFLNEEESWNLLRERVFGEEYYPFQLEKHGRKIAENC